MEKGNKAKNFLKAMESKDVWFMLHFLLDVLTVLHDVSQTFQGKTVTVCEIMDEINVAIQHLEKLKQSDGLNLRDGYSKQPDGLKGNDTAFIAARSKLVTVLMNALQKRYFENDEIMEACSVMNLAHFPLTRQDAEDYGDDSIKRLVDYFREALSGAGVDIGNCELEWTKLKNHLFTRFDKPRLVSWEDINTKLKSDCPNILDLVDLLLAIPASSSDAERGFNRVKYTKNDFRSILCDSNLSDQLMIMLESASVSKFNPLPAIELWNLTPRRLRETAKCNVTIESELGVVQEQSFVNNIQITNQITEDDGDEDYVSYDDYVYEKDVEDMVELNASYSDRIALASKVYKNFRELFD